MLRSTYLQMKTTRSLCYLRMFTNRMMSCEQVDCLQLKIMECVNVDVDLGIWLCVDENVCKWMWDQALRKTTYVPLSKRIKCKRSLKCGKCFCGCGKTAYVPLSERIISERSLKCEKCRWMCRLLVWRCKIVWLWTFSVVFQNICGFLVWKWKMFFIGDDFNCLQQPENICFWKDFMFSQKIRKKKKKFVVVVCIAS